MKSLRWVSIVGFLLTLANCEGENEHNNDKEKQHIPVIALSIVFVFGGLLYGGFLRMLAKRTYIPYSPLVLLSGLLLGNFYQELPDFMGSSIKLVSGINPHAILAIFLPALIFDSAFKAEWHLFKKQSAQTLILGVPCALISSMLIMIAVKAILKIEAYSWVEALLLGTILSCTDIFSFVSKLRQDGTPKKVIGLIEGESLFNYCSCVMMFQIVNELIIDDSYTVFNLIGLIFQEIFGGILFGTIFALTAIYWLRRMAYDGVLVVSVMVIFCYTIYLIAEFTTLTVSGICALVSYGILMGGFGKAQLSNQANQYVHGFWKYVVFVAETNIFFIAGVMVGVHVFTIREELDSSSLATLFSVYLVVIASRFISIGLFMKWLPKLGYGMQWKEAIVVSIGGLKGAIGVSFAMIVFENKLYDEIMRDMFLLHVTGNSILTLLINSVATRILVRLLRLSTLTKVEYKFFKQFLGQFKKSIQDKMSQMKNDRFLDIVDWSVVQTKVGLPEYARLENQTQKMIEKIKQIRETRFQKRQLYKLEIMLRQFATKNNTVAIDMAENEVLIQITEFQTVVQVRKRFIKSLIEKYWEYHEKNHTSPPAVILLLQSAYFDLDTETQQLQSWEWIKGQLSQQYIKFLTELRKNRVIGWLARNYLFNYISYCYDVVSSYIEALEEVMKQFKQSYILSVNEKCLELILNESAENRREAEDFLNNYLKPSFPEIDTEVKTKKASFNLLFSFKNIIDRFEETGQLQSNQYEMLNTLIIEKTLTLELHSPKWKINSLIELYEHHEVFGLLPKRVLQMLEQNLSDMETHDANEFIITQSSICKYIYFIRRGSCSVEYSKETHSIYKQQLLVGDIFGQEALVSPTYQSTVVANAMVVVLRVKKICVQKIMDTFPEFEQIFWKRYLFFFFKMYFNKKDITFHINHLDQQQFKQIIEEFRLVKLSEGLHTICEDSIILRGVCKDIEEMGNSPLSPLTFIYGYLEMTIRVIGSCSLLVGVLPTHKFEETVSSKMPSLVFKNSVLDSSIVKRDRTFRQWDSPKNSEKR